MQGGGVLIQIPDLGVKLWPPGPLPTLPTFVGESNPHGPDPKHALFCWPVGSAGWRLAHVILGLSRRTYLSCPRLNLLVGNRWSVPAAREAATAVLNAHPAGPLILLGRRVAVAFGVAEVPTFGSKQIIGGPLVVVLPHPSGRCRDWNEPDAVARARAAVGAVCPGLPLGEDAPAPPIIDGEIVEET